MNTILINNQELEVIKLTPFAYMSGKGEKTLQIKVAAEVAGFDALKELFEGNENAIQYKEDDKLVCEYVGYSAFECQYTEGVFSIELKKGTLVDQMTALLNANETLSKAINTLEKANAQKQETIEKLEAQNELLMQCVMEMSEIIYA